MLNCRVKGSLVLVCFAFIWKSNDHYGEVRYHLSQTKLSSDNFDDIFTFIFFLDFRTLFSLFYLKKNKETQKSGSSLSYDWSINQIVFQVASSVFQPYNVGFAEFNLKTLNSQFHRTLLINYWKSSFSKRKNIKPAHKQANIKKLVFW